MGKRSMPATAVVDPGRHLLSIAHLGAGQVIQVDTATDHVVRVVTLDETTGAELGRAPTGDCPDGLAYDAGSASHAATGAATAARSQPGVAPSPCSPSVTGTFECSDASPSPTVRRWSPSTLAVTAATSRSPPALTASPNFSSVSGNRPESQADRPSASGG
jgi:hypothetical protein